MSNTNLNVNGRKAKMSLTYWKFFCGREPRVGDQHVCDGWHYQITSISGGIVYVSKRQIRGQAGKGGG